MCDWVPFVQFKKRENTHGGVLLLVQLQVLACNFNNSDITPRVFFTFFELYIWYQIAQSLSHICMSEIDLLTGSSEDLSQVNKTLPRHLSEMTPQLTFTCSKSTAETIEKGIKYVQN